jgi:nitrogenase molybdenum-cofactor synthesis protein NifE
VDDANSTELPDYSKNTAKPLIQELKKNTLFKLGVPFCDFNHDPISDLQVSEVFVSFAKEVDASVSSPVFN